MRGRFGKVASWAVPQAVAPWADVSQASPVREPYAPVRVFDSLMLQMMLITVFVVKYLEETFAAVHLILVCMTSVRTLIREV